MPVSLDSDVVEEIIRYLVPEDYCHTSNTQGLSDILACAKVCWPWCSIAIPLLWKRPFNSSIDENKKHQSIYNNQKVVEILLSFLDFHELNEMDPDDIRFLMPKQNDPRPLFQYASFMTCLNYGEMLSPLIGSQNLSAIARGLLRVMQQQGARLDCIITQGSYSFPNEVYSPIASPEFSMLISPIKIFNFHKYFPVKQFLPAVSNLCQNLGSITAQLHYLHTDRDGRAVINPLCTLIRSQRSLYELRVTDIKLFTPALMEAIATQVDHLRQIELYYADFSGCPQWNVLARCRNLEVLKMVACRNATSEMIAPLIATTFPHLTKVYLKSIFDNSAFEKLKEWARQCGILIE